MSKSPVFLTGCAGFIGMHTAKRLLAQGETVVGVDNINPYYSVELKRNRLKELEHENFHFYEIDISDRQTMEKVWATYEPKRVINLAAQAGVRYSIENPFAYIASNITGFLVILELCRHQKDFENLVYASTSSIYGSNTQMPFTEDQMTALPISLYAATKSGNELMAQSYNYLYGLPVTGLRFFTVYGPWGRPDMAAFKFTKAILAGEPLDLYNSGKMKRDFTYVDDIVSGIVAAVNTKPTNKKGERHPIYNLGNNRCEDLPKIISLIEETLGKKALINPMPMQLGDVQETYANIDKAKADLGYSPQTTIDQGIPNFVRWYIDYHK
ncbi:SDR family NAD(P)-dependent oxidoreductase [Candidatus Odyssella thessalonicensis]|uniref:SDR family NAD(P)-dependent oxidoreductase n=1 Tax=Candidatus Odyssella thessalonicensis TaxID=84647 RepID=UPI000225B4EC|nr:SDR family NAD(P)-dependent oxidoreductase [Candidatus Odyssella thessalonicensis]